MGKLYFWYEMALIRLISLMSMHVYSTQSLDGTASILAPYTLSQERTSPSLLKMQLSTLLLRLQEVQ